MNPGFPRLEVIHIASARGARSLRDAGYCPVECAFGAESVVDDLQMDHHGALSHLEPVSVRAYRDYPLSRWMDRRFVVTGAADADATFAIAALAGLLPHPSQLANANRDPLRVGTAGRDSEHAKLLTLAQTIAQADQAPCSSHWLESEPGLLLLGYKQQMNGAARNSAAFHAGVEYWSSALTSPPSGWLDKVRSLEVERLRAARAAAVDRLSSWVAFVESPAWGWDVWYAEIAPIIVAYNRTRKHCTIGCRDEATATRNFGPRGLLSLLSALEPPGWGGRPDIIGSPRGRELSRAEAQAAAQILVAVTSPGLERCRTDHPQTSGRLRVDVFG